MPWQDLRKGRYSQINGEYFITFNCLNKTPLFNTHATAKYFCQQIKINEQLYQCTWLTWVLMPDHFHGLLQVNHSLLGKIVGDLKGRTSRVIKQATGISDKIWQPNYYDRALRKEENRRAIARYIVANPLRKGLVNNVGDYPYWNSVYL